MMRKKSDKTPNVGRLKLLLVDDGSLVTPALMRTLTGAAFRVEVVADPECALADARSRHFDAVAINADYADWDPLWLCLALRTQGCPSVILIVGQAPTDGDRLAAWRAGATDRVGRGLPHDALVERLLAHIAGAGIKATGLIYPLTAELPTNAGLIKLSLVPTVVTLDDEPISLTRIEERLFARFCSARGTAVLPDELIAAAWQGTKVSAATLQVHLSQLRRKLDKLGLAIERIGQRGYRLPLVTPPIVVKTSKASGQKN